MKLILIAFMLCNLQGIKAQNSIKMKTSKEDKTTIVKGLENYYFKGIYEGNVSLLKQIFNEGTLLYGDIKGEPYTKTLDQYLNNVQNRQSPRDSGTLFKGEIIAIKIVNSIAIAEVKIKMYDFIYYDLLSFHKIEGKWLIVNKMLTDVKP